MHYSGMDFHKRFFRWLIETNCGHRVFTVEAANDDIMMLICGG